MRKVAVTVAVLSLLALVPPTQAAEDQCQLAPAEGIACLALPVQKPVSPPGAPGVPPEANAYFGTYYLWVGPGDCTGSVIAGGCRGVPASPGSGVPLPTGGAVGAGVFGVLYEESNNAAGLQRQQFAEGGLRLPDHMVLV